MAPLNDSRDDLPEEPASPPADEDDLLPDFLQPFPATPRDVPGREPWRNYASSDTPPAEQPAREPATGGDGPPALPIPVEPMDVEPIADAPVVDVPVANLPVADAPVADAPVADVPVAVVPVVDVPVADVPVADVPVADAPEPSFTPLSAANPSAKQENFDQTESVAKGNSFEPPASAAPSVRPPRRFSEIPVISASGNGNNFEKMTSEEFTAADSGLSSSPDLSREERSLPFNSTPPTASATTDTELSPSGPTTGATADREPVEMTPIGETGIEETPIGETGIGETAAVISKSAEGEGAHRPARNVDTSLALVGGSEIPSTPAASREKIAPPSSRETPRVIAAERPHPEGGVAGVKRRFGGGKVTSRPKEDGPLPWSLAVPSGLTRPPRESPPEPSRQPADGAEQEWPRGTPEPSSTGGEVSPPPSTLPSTTPSTSPPPPVTSAAAVPEPSSIETESPAEAEFFFVPQVPTRKSSPSPAGGSGRRPMRWGTGSAPKSQPTSPAPAGAVDSEAEKAELVAYTHGKRPLPAPGETDWWGVLWCSFTAFAASVCIMALEMTASRLINVHVGASLYTWTSVIGVVLAGISGGNFLGGWLADRYPPARSLAVLFVASGLLTFSVLWLNFTLTDVNCPQWLDWRLWVMFVVSWLFLLPSISLGTISPVAAAQALGRSHRPGLAVGVVYASGTLGSILGTFLTGFVLLDVLGTRMIIVTVAIALLLMGALVAVGERAFRTGVILGGVQLLATLGLLAGSTQDGLAMIADTLANSVSPFSSSEARTDRVSRWNAWGRQVGLQLHQLGLNLCLRSDHPEDYLDDSGYYTIQVRQIDHADGKVKVLKLDQLAHSYYNPVRPLELYYEYERVYAAVTEHAASQWQRRFSVPLPQVPASDTFVQRLPRGVRYFSAHKRLEVQGAMSWPQFKQLCNIGPYAAYWQGVLNVWEQWQKPLPEYELIGADLQELPPGLSLPPAWEDRLAYSPILRRMTSLNKFSLDEAIQLMSLGEHKAYLQQVYQLYRQSRTTSSLFIGGGGFVFPRWIEAKFPHDPIIDVAEIDPAVKLAVQKQLGFPADDRTAIQTYLGDARMFVDERRRKNQALQAATSDDAGRSSKSASNRKTGPRQYDFIYGDAFNGYSVPWHLTTREFSEKIYDLLTPQEGIYLVNIIDMFPRVEYPPAGELRGFGSVDHLGKIPATLLPGGEQRDQWVKARFPFDALEVLTVHTGEKYRLRYQGVMTPKLRESLEGLVAPETQGSKGTAGSSPAEGWNELEVFLFREAIKNLFEQSHERKTYDEPLPPVLVPVGLFNTVFDDSWRNAEPPFQFVQVKPVSEGRLLLGVRGVLSEATRRKLIELAPQNTSFHQAVDFLHAQSRRQRGGGFLGRYVNTLRQVFPNVYVFSGNEDQVGEQRDTFVVVAALQKLDLTQLEKTGQGHWRGKPFAWSETDADGHLLDLGQMSSLLELARDQILTDDFAPVDNLLVPVFVDQNRP